MTEKKLMGIDDFDLVSDSEKPFDLELISPKTGKPTGVIIKVLGENAGVVQKFLRSEVDRKRHERSIKDKRGDDTITPIDEDIDFAVEACVVRTASWEGLKEPFSKENARKLYVKNPKIRQQILEASNNAANFSRA